MEITLENLQDKLNVDRSVAEVISRAIEETGVRFQLPGDYEVSVSLVDDYEIAEMNKKYRGVDSATDVLSFPLMEFLHGQPTKTAGPRETLMGDIVISLERAEWQAREYGHSFNREIGFLTVHAMLHILGFDHETREDELQMGELLEQILRPLSLSR